MKGRRGGEEGAGRKPKAKTYQETTNKASSCAEEKHTNRREKKQNEEQTPRIQIPCSRNSTLLLQKYPTSRHKRRNNQTNSKKNKKNKQTDRVLPNMQHSPLSTQNTSPPLCRLTRSPKLSCRRFSYVVPPSPPTTAPTSFLILLAVAASSGLSSSAFRLMLLLVLE